MNIALKRTLEKINAFKNFALVKSKANQLECNHRKLFATCLASYIKYHKRIKVRKWVIGLLINIYIIVIIIIIIITVLFMWGTRFAQWCCSLFKSFSILPRVSIAVDVSKFHSALFFRVKMSCLALKMKTRIHRKVENGYLRRQALTSQKAWISVWFYFFNHYWYHSSPVGVPGPNVTVGWPSPLIPIPNFNVQILARRELTLSYNSCYF